MNRLEAPDAAERCRAAGELGDVLGSTAVSQSVTERVAASLVSRVPRERDREARECALHALTRALERGWLPYTVVEPLTEVAPHMDAELLGYVLGILAGSRDPAARPVIERYAGHPTASVRADAAEALAEIAEVGEQNR